MTRFLLLVALAVLLSALPADAQRRRAQPFAEKGDVALVATLDGLASLRLEPLLGGVGVRFRLADQTVLGTSLGLSVSTADTEREDGDQDSSNSQDRSDATVSVWVEQHLGRPRRLVSPFVGGGVQVGGGTTTSTSEDRFLPCGPDQDCDPVVRTFENEQRTVRVGAGVFVGAEVRLAAGVTLGGAYTFGIGYTDTEVTTELGGDRIDDQTWTSRFLNVGTGTSRISLSVYL